MFHVGGIIGNTTVYLAYPFEKTFQAKWTADVTLAHNFENIEQAISARFLVLTSALDVEEINVKPRQWSLEQLGASGSYKYIIKTLMEERPEDFEVNGLTAHKALERFQELAKDFFHSDFIDRVTVEFDVETQRLTFRIPCFEEYPKYPFLSSVH